MFQVFIQDEMRLFKFLSAAKAFAKAAGVWYYITDSTEVIYTQDDEILEGLYES